MAAAQRTIVLRAARAYRTVSHVGATILAGVPPVHLIAASYAEMYDRTKAIKEMRGVIPPRAKRALKQQVTRSLILKWKEFLQDPRLPGERVRQAIQPVLEDWLERRRRGSTFHTTQVISGHGCFGQYLCRIGKEGTTHCHHCPEEVDTAQHTLEFCPAWEERRRVLRATVGNDLSLQAIIRATVEGNGDEKWGAFASFCNAVMGQKEADERIRRGEVNPPPPESDSDNGGRGKAPRPPPQVRRRRRRRQGGQRAVGALAGALDAVAP
ncbi:uncharacterized protein LOC112457981 [Temnothorax curvispinosus]|uniref:Uncharacterized protein LOC112457981 n=1 Tax=Temnothorax curvispinosus TaxID=300111 RepID=A0A6J1Q4H8_9HYME|nr:uncharacterized protein LOC112457981 [Temnothorax curvispinosus]